MIDFDQSTRRGLRRILDQGFPDGTVGQRDIEALALAIYERRYEFGNALPDELKTINLGPYENRLKALAESLPSDAEADLDDHRYYWIESTHTRLDPDHYHPFTGQLPMVRVRMPQSQPKTYRTKIGTVEPDDHLLTTVDEYNEECEEAVGYKTQRVELVTPPRDHDTRFGAISVYMGYRNKTDPNPSNYVLEAGTATGQAKVIYLGTTLDARIYRYGGYKPTPFSCASNSYEGRVSWNDDSPEVLTIKARKIANNKAQSPYIKIEAKFTELNKARSVWPGWLIAEAASIVVFRQMRGLKDGCSHRTSPEEPQDNG